MVFHRGHTEAELPGGVEHVHGDQAALAEFAADFRAFRPEAVVHMMALSGDDARRAVGVFRGVARRLVLVSSMDVYRAYDRLLRAAPGRPEPIPLREDAPLREKLYPHRARAAGPGDIFYHYEKIHAEGAVADARDLSWTILRLPAVYGPGDRQHRCFEHLVRMADGRPAILMSEGRAGWRWTRAYVEDVASAIALATVSEAAANRVYNVGERDALTEAEWVRALAAVVGWRGRLVVLPDEALPEHLRSPFDWRQDMVASSRRLREELGYEESHSRREALEGTVRWELENPPASGGLVDYPAEDAVLEQRAG